MKQVYILLIGMLICAQSAFAENKVLNPSFEEKLNANFCPSGYHQSQFPYPASNWRVAGTADYFHTCATSSLAKPGDGHELPRNGQAYAGIIAYVANSQHPGLQEYLIQDLGNRKLVAGKRYLVEFWVSLSDYANYSVSSLGMYLAGASHTADNAFDLAQLNPQVKSGSFVTNRAGWTKISGYVTPTEDITKIIIGNFNNDITQQYREEPGGCGSSSAGQCNELRTRAYYYIDDVKIEEDCSIPGVNQGAIYGLREDGTYWDSNVEVCPSETITLQVSGLPNATYFRWEVDSWATIMSGQGTNTISLRVPHAVGFGGVANVYATNGCGISSTVINAQTSYWVGSCSGGVDWLTAYPNPATNAVTVQISPSSENKKGPIEAKLYDSQGRMRKSLMINQAKTVIDTSGLPRGIYYLHVSDGKRLDKKQITIE